MIELFTIFGKGGLVLWCFQEGKETFNDAVNELISTVLLQQRTVPSLNRQGMTLKYRLDNEFDLVMVVSPGFALALSPSSNQFHPPNHLRWSTRAWCK